MRLKLNPRSMSSIYMCKKSSWPRRLCCKAYRKKGIVYSNRNIWKPWCVRLHRGFFAWDRTCRHVWIFLISNARGREIRFSSHQKQYKLLRAGVWEEHEGGMTLTFKAFLAASASDRLSKLTNPTGWGDKKTEQKKETWFKAEYWVGTSVWVT